MPQTVQDVINAATLYSDDYLYRFVHIPANGITVAAGIVAEAGTPFCALLVDKDEVSLMIEEEDYEQFKKRLIGHTVSDTHYRLITFDVVLEPTLVGFMAKISTALAQSGISVMPFAAYSRDHIFVAKADFDQAIAVLEALKTPER